MKTFEDFRGDVKVYEDAVNGALIKKYKAFMDYMSKMVPAIFKDNEQEIISWLNATDNYHRLILSACTGGIHYIKIAIGLSDDESHIVINWFAAHDQYYDPKIDFCSDDKSISGFFEREFDNFFKLCAPCGDIDNMIIELTNQFNSAIYEEFGSMFKSIGLDTVSDFRHSKYALTFSDEKLSEIGNEISTYYDEFSKIVTESNHAIDVAKKVLCSD